MPEPDSRTYIRLHDGMPDHPKIDGLSDRAFRLLIETWCWCSRHLTDGHVPTVTWSKRGTPATRRELIAAGLVEERDTGVWMHDYLKHQRSAEEVAELKEKRREAGRRGGLAKSRNLASAKASAKQVAKQSAKQNLKQTRSKTVASTDTYTDTATDVAVFGSSGTAPASGDATAQTLIGEWLDHSPARPPKAVIGQVAKHLKAMLAEGIDAETLRAGLIAWHAKGLHPSTLPSVVHEEQKRALRVVEDPDAWMRRTL